MENKDIIKEKAINYIRHSSWYPSFHRNFKKYFRFNPIELYFDHINPKDYLYNVFILEDDPEIIKVWHNINDEYLKFLESIEKELTNKTTNNMEEKIIKFDLSKYRADSTRYEVRNKKGNKMTILVDDLNDERYKIVARNEETSEILHYNEKGRLFNTIESINDLDLVEKNINKDKKKYYVVILKPLIPMLTEDNTSYVSYMFSSKEEAQKAEGDTPIFKYIKTVEVEIDE